MAGKLRVVTRAEFERTLAALADAQRSNGSDVLERGRR
jgi:hypothetical protein